MSELEIKKSKTVTSTVRLVLTREQVEEMVVAAVEKDDRKLRDYGLKCTITAGSGPVNEWQPGGFSCVVDGTKTTGGE